MSKTCENTIMQAIRSIASDALDGHLSTIDAYLALNEIEKSVTEAKEQIKKLAYDEIEKTGEKIYCHNGFKLQCMAKTTWKYDHISGWIEKKNQMKEIEQKAQMAAKSNLNGNFETGEVIEPAIASYSYYIKIERNG